MKKLMMVCAMAALVFAMSGVAQATTTTISIYAAPAPDAEGLNAPILSEGDEAFGKDEWCIAASGRDRTGRY